MTRSIADRMADVRRLLKAARVVFEQRERLVAGMARSTGLSREGVELGFSCLEREATDDELLALVGSAGDSREVHVILSANVFVAPLRALAIARAAAARVTVRPSPRDATLARVLIEAARDAAITLTNERDVRAVRADDIHVYGRDETIAAVRLCARAGVRVRGHGAGLGLAVITRTAIMPPAAESLASDVVLFDQRGCLSPRLVLVEGDESRAEQFAQALHECLAARAERIPRGELSEQEREQAAQWRETVAFAGQLWTGASHAVGTTSSTAPLLVPPPGRHVHVAAVPTIDELTARLRSFERFVVTVGTDDPIRLTARVPAHARVARLGFMQRPPLDGPVDQRSF